MLSHMDEAAAVIIKAIQVFGALLSSRPEVLGDAAAAAPTTTTHSPTTTTPPPQVSHLEAYRGQDLSKWGAARAATVRRLHRDATKAFTDADLFRSDSAEASTVALFFNRLESYLKGSHTTSAARPYLNLAATIFRDLNGDVFNISTRRVVFVAGWELLVEDAFWSAWKASELMISDWLMSRIVHPFDINTSFSPSIDSLKQDASSTDPLVFLKPLAFVWLGMVGLVRKAVSDVTLGAFWQFATRPRSTV